jgi:hypothetical protein
MALSFPRGKGHIPNHPARRPKSVLKHALFSSILAGSDPIPDSVDNREFFPPVMDQVGTSECESHTEAEVTFASLNANGTPLGFVPSPTKIYQIANGLQRAAYNPGTSVQDLPPLEDDGLEPIFATQAVGLFGVVPMIENLGQGSDASTYTAANEADPITFVRGSTKIVRGASSLDVYPDHRVAALCKLLAARKFVKVALYADWDGFMEYGPGSDPLGAPPVANPWSDHAVPLVDYRTEGGTKIFRLLNHWSTGWGQAGYFEVLPEFVLTFTDLEVVDAVLDSKGGSP